MENEALESHTTFFFLVLSRAEFSCVSGVSVFALFPNELGRNEAKSRDPSEAFLFISGQTRVNDFSLTHSRKGHNSSDKTQNIGFDVMGRSR
jgi:hypothetical protein